MQSKTSFFNKYLYLKTILRFWPLWVIVSIGGAITAVVATDVSSFKRYSGSGLAAEVFGTEATSMFPIVSMIYAIVVAMCVWSYLYNKNSNYCFHSMPITRTGLFVTNFLAGLTMMIIPFAVAATLQIAMIATITTMAYREMFFAIAAAVVECFFFFSFATVTAFVTSNIMALPVLYMVFNFLQVGITGITNVLRTGFYPGASSSDYNSLSFLSPVVWIVTKINFTGRYIYDEDRRVYDVTDAQIEHASYLWILVGVGILFVALSLLAYRSKRSEDVGHVVSVKWLRPVLLAIFTYCAATCGAVIVGEFSHGFSSESYFSIPAMCFLLSLFGVIAICVGIMLLQGTTKIFSKKTVCAGLLTVVFFVGFSVILGYDLFHTARHIPEVSEIENVVASFPGDKYVINIENHRDIIENLVLANEKIADDSLYIKAAERKYTSEQTTEYLNITYTLKNGRKMNKKYSFPITRARIADPATYDYALDSFINNPKCQLLTYCLTDEFEIFAATVNAGNGFYDDIDEDKLKGLADAARADILAGNIKKSFFGEEEGYEVILDMSFEEVKPVDDDEWRNTWACFTLNKEMTNIVNYLLDNDIINESMLVEGSFYYKGYEY